MDQIHLTGIRAYGYTGLLPEEQQLGQWFEVELILALDIQRAGQSDRIEDTFDYRAAIATVQELIRTSRFALVERLATAIADAILANPQLVQVQVRLTKLHPPIPDFSGQVTIALTRSRP